MTTESLYSIAGTLGGTFFGSFLIGYFIKKIIKILMFILGGILALLMYLQSQVIINVEVNTDKIQSSVEALVTTIVANTTNVFPSDGNSSITGNNLGIPLTGSIASGFMLGITRNKVKERQGMMMKLFSRWKKGNTYTLSQNNKPIIIKNKHNLFDEIVGFGDVKDLFKMAIQAERPVHLLLCGPPSSGKSLFMSSLNRLERSYYAVGSSSTKSGIFDYLFEHRPRYFIIDEIEKMNKKDQTSLLNLMESGILTELKHKQRRTTQLKTWVFASCNSTDKLLPPLITRFRVIQFKPYTEEEFVEIVVNILDREEGVDRDIALLIADGVFNRLESSNIRECVRIARLTRNDSDQINRIIDTFAKYGKTDMVVR